MDYQALEEHIKDSVMEEQAEAGISQRSDPVVLPCGHVK